jgi:hypothetical protein
VTNKKGRSRCLLAVTPEPTRLPFDSPEIGAFLDALEADPARLARIRCENLRQAALRHDWVHRLRTVFETLGIQPTAAMLAREQRLRALAAQVQAGQGGVA